MILFLIAFLQSEKEKEQAATPQAPYVGFKDYGPPVNGEFIKKFGYTVPERHYVALGDNHAMSSDSRVFGAVPEQNVQGAPWVTLWPRPGEPAQKPYPFMNVPRAIVWTVAAIISLLSWLFLRWKHRQPIVHLKH